MATGLQGLTGLKGVVGPTGLQGPTGPTQRQLLIIDARVQHLRRQHETQHAAMWRQLGELHQLARDMALGEPYNLSADDVLRSPTRAALDRACADALPPEDATVVDPTRVHSNVQDEVERAQDLVELQRTMDVGFRALADVICHVRLLLDNIGHTSPYGVYMQRDMLEAITDDDPRVMQQSSAKQDNAPE